MPARPAATDLRGAELESWAEQLDATPVPDEYRTVVGYQRAVLDHGIRGYGPEAEWLGGLVGAETT